MRGNSSYRTWCHSVALYSPRNGAIRTLLSYTIFVAFFAVLLVPQHGHAESPLPGQVTFGVGGSEQEVAESFDALYPLYAPKNGLLFFNPKLITSDELDPRVSLGFGYRQLFEKPQVILGANVFYDNFDTVNNNRINQVGFGGEILTRWVDIRANLYLPDQKRYKIDQTQTTSASTTSSSSMQSLGQQITSQTLGYQSYNIAETTSGFNVQQTTTTSEEIQTTHFFDREEAAMSGGDVEAGVLLPWLDRYADVRVFGGYYHFDNKFGKNIEGPESRLEIRAVPAVTFDAMYYSDKEVIGSHWFCGVRFNVPFDLANIAEGRSPFAGFWDSFKPRSKGEHPVFASRLTENVIRTSRVSTSTSKLMQIATTQKVIGSSTTTQDSFIPFSQSLVLTLDGIPITVTHVDSAATSPGNGTFESPYRTLTLADTDPVKRNIVLLDANSVFIGQGFHLTSGQQLVGDAAGITHLINTDQLGTIALPHPTSGTALPILSNPGGTVITLANNVAISGLNITNSANGIVGAPGASNVTISSMSFSNMTAAAINISPATNVSLNNLTFQNNFQDVILDAANSVITNVTSTGATHGSISLVGTAGITMLTNVNISGAGGYGLSVTNPGGTHNITNLNITGGTGDGVDITGGAGVFAFDATSSITNPGGTAFNINSGSSTVNFNGTIAGSATGRSVQIQNHTGGAVTFFGNVTDSGLGINLANNTGGSIAFSGPTQKLNTGANNALTLNANNGANISFSNLIITTTTGTGIAATGVNSSVTLAGTNNPGPGAPAFTFTNTSGTYDDSGLTSSQSNLGVTFGNTQTGTYKLGSLAITNAPGTAFSATGSAANIALTNLTLTDAAGTGLSLTGETGSFTVTGTTTINTPAADGIDLSNISGPVNLGNVNITNATTGVFLTGSSAAVTAGTITVNGATTGLQFGTNTGSFTAGGATNLTNITTTGINANGATGTYLFQGLSISLTGGVINSRGIDFRKSDVQFQTNNLSINGNGTTTGSIIGIDLSGSSNPNGVNSTSPNILLATGLGQTAVISNVNTGVLLGDGTVGSAGANLIYGNQTPIASGGSGSSINVLSGGVTIDTTNLVSTGPFVQGRYEFTGVTFTGLATFEGPKTGFIFVGASSTGNDTGTNPTNTISVAQLLTLDATPSNLNDKTVVFVNDGSINFGATTLTLGTDTTIDGFGNGHTVLVPSGQPANVIGDNFVAAGGSFTDPRGAATLTSNAAVNVLTLGNGDTAQNIDINGGNNQIFGSGTVAFTLNGVVQTNAGASAISLTNATGTIAMTGGSISGAAGNSFVIDGGNAAVSYSGNITNAAAHSAVVQNLTGGSVTLSGVINDTGTGILVQNNTGGTTTFSGLGDTFNTGANQAVTLTNNTGATTNFTGGNLAITTTSATGFGASGGGTVGVTGTGNTITSGSGTGLSLNGVTIGGSGFVLQSVSANGSVNGIALNNLTGGGTVGVQVTGTGTTAASGGTIQNTTGAALSLTSLGSLGGGVTLNNVNISGGGGILGTTFGTLSVANDSVSATGAAALSLTTGTIAGTFSALSSSGSATNGISLDTITGGVNLGNVSVTNAASTGLLFTNSGAAVTAGTVIVNGATTGLQFGANTGSFSATGATTLSNITTTGIDANGATGTYSFTGLTIVFTGTVANTRGIDFRSSDLQQFETGSLSITGNGTATSIAVDLSGSLYPGGQPVTANAPNILLATAAGQTAVISSVNTGVLLGDTTVGSAGAYLKYGNQTPIASGGSGSSINVLTGGVTIDTTDLTTTSGFMQGRYEFTGVTFTGLATFERAGNPNFIFVGATSSGNDSGSNPSNTISVAQLLTLDGTPANLNGKTVVFVNDGSINFGATTLTLGTGTIIDGFGNGNTVVVPNTGTQPANVIGDTFVLGGGSFTDPRGAATLTANAAVNVLTLGSGDTVQNIDISGGNNQVFGSGIAGFTMNGVVQTTAGASAIHLTNTTGTIAMTGGSISSAAGDSFVVDGGNSVVTYSGNITNTAAHSVVVENRTGGSVTLSGTITDPGTGILVQNNTGGTTTFSGSGDTFNTGANQAVTLTNNTGSTINFTGGNLAITTTSATGFGATGGGTVSVTGTGNTITSGTGTALSLNGVTIGSSGFLLQSVSANGAVNGIALNNLTGGGTVGVQVTGTGSTAGSGGTIQNTTGAAVSLTNLGSLGGGTTLNYMNITGGGGILGTTFGTLSVANDSVSATGAAALSLTTGAITTGSTFSTLSSSGSTTNGVLLSVVTGGFAANGGAISGSTGDAWSVTGGSVSATYSGNITQTNNAALVSVSGGHTGTLTFQTGTLSATNGTGLQFNDANGVYNFNGTTTLNGGAAGINIFGGSSGAFAFSTNTSITNPAGIAFSENGSTANVTYNGTISQTNAFNAVSINAETGGTTTFGGAITANTTTANAVNLTGNTGGAIDFTGGGLAITTTTGIGFNATGGGTIGMTGTGNTITSGTGTAFNLNGIAIGGSGFMLQSVSANGAGNGITLDTVTGTGTLNLGNASVANATTGLVLANSSVAVTAGTVTINGATTGLQFGANTGSFTANGATNLTNITTTGINANGATGSYLFNNLTIGFAGTVATSRGIDFRSSDLQFQTGNLSITGNGTATSIGIDLSGSLYPGGQPVTANAPNILLATAAGQTAVISSVNTGVLLGDTTRLRRCVSQVRQPNPDRIRRQR